MKPRDIEFKGMVEGRTHSDGRQVFRAIASTTTLDRGGDVMLSRGVRLDNFLKNPVMLESHGYEKSSVGQVIDIQVTDSAVTFDFVFSKDTRGQDLEQKYRDGDQRAFSIGARGIKVLRLYYPWEDAPEINSVKVELPDGSSTEVDFTTLGAVPNRIFNEWELLEISPVAVPMNPEALMLSAAADLIKQVSDRDPVMKSFVQEDMAKVYGPIIKAMEEFEARFGSADTYQISGQVEPHTTKTEDAPWSRTDAKTALAVWASTKGTGKKEDMSWAKYSKGFAKFKGDEAKSITAYDLLHHTVKDGELIAIWKGVTAAMATLLKTCGSKDLGVDDQAAYKHLVGHYVDFGKTAPVIKDYTEAELKDIEDECLVCAEKSTDEATPATPEAGTEGKSTPDPDAMTAQLIGLAGAIKALHETVEENFTASLIKLSIIGDAIESKGTPKEKTETPSDEKSVSEEFTISRETLDSLERLAV